MSTRFPLAKVPSRAARWSATHPWRAIGGWLVFVIAAVALASVVSTERPIDADYRVGESGRADAMLEDAGLVEPPAERVLISAPDGRLDPAAGGAAAATVTDEMADVPGVAAVGDPVPSRDGTALLVPVIVDSEDIDAAPLLAATAAAQAAHPDLRIAQTGDLTLEAAFEDRLGEDLRSAELISVPIVLILMLLAFGALIAAGVPVLFAATSVAATIGITAPVSHLVPADLSVDSMIVLIGVAVGVDYSLFYLKRARQERQAGRTTLDAVEIAAETSGHAILVSGGAVIAALASLFVLTDATFASLATGAIIVVAVAVLGSITVLPALLVKLGRWVDRPRIPGLWRLNRRIGRGGISGRLVGPVVRHPVLALAIATVAIGALAVPALDMTTHEENIEAVPADIAAVQTYKKIIAAYPGEGTTATVVVTADPADRADVVAALRRLAGAAAETGDFTAGGEVRTSKDGATSVIELAMPYPEGDDRVADAIDALRADLAPTALDGVAEAWTVGGQAAHTLDDSAKRADRLPLLLGLVLLLTFLMMAGAFRSMVLGAVSTLLNLVSVGVAFGVLVVVFQRGLGESLLDFTSPGFVIDWVPIFVLAVLVGLSMDYHVFVVSRIRELVARGVSTRTAVHDGIVDTAGVVTSAAAVMVSVFAIFATVSLIEIKMLGVGLAAAILLDATLIRLVVLPAVLVLLGDRTWWPSRPARPADRPGRRTRDISSSRAASLMGSACAPRAPLATEWTHGIERKENTMTDTTRQPAAPTLEALRTAWSERDYSTTEERMTLIRMLADGDPLTAEALAHATGIEASEVRALIEAARALGVEVEDGAVVGAALTLRPTAYRFRVRGHDLYAWCGFDTIFLPMIIGEPATVASTCPVTGQEIRLTVAPDGTATGVQPPGVVVAVVGDEIMSCSTSGPDSVICTQMPFFASRQAGETWSADHPGTAILHLTQARSVARAYVFGPAE